MPAVRGRLTQDAPLAPLVWFKAGGAADWLFEPADADDLSAFLRELDPAVPVYPLGLGSNLIVRDGGMPGVVVRLGKAFAKVERVDATSLRCGGGASGILVSSSARDAGIAGIEFLRSIPGTVGGFVRMNGGAYGREVADVLRSATVLLRSGERVTLSADQLGYSYRHSALPEGAVVIEAVFEGRLGDPAVIGAEMARIAAEREASQPLRSKTGGSTFKNPSGHKAWALVDAAGCRGLTRGAAQVSEKHCNFLLNLGSATSADIEALGEDVRARVLVHAGVALEWEIQRVGRAASPLPGRSAACPSPLEGEGLGHPSLSLQGRGTGAKRQGEGVTGRGKTPDLLLEHSRSLRANQTEGEARLWARLRAGRLEGLKFRRQVPLGPYIADFVCPAARLVVELDGSQHVDDADYDAARTGYLEAQGYRVMRVWNNDVLERMEGVLEAISAAASPLPGRSAACPSPLEGEGLGHPSLSIQGRGKGEGS